MLRRFPARHAAREWPRRFGGGFARPSRRGDPTNVKGLIGSAGSFPVALRCSAPRELKRLGLKPTAHNRARAKFKPSVHCTTRIPRRYLRRSPAFSTFSAAHVCWVDAFSAAKRKTTPDQVRGRLRRKTLGEGTPMFGFDVFAIVIVALAVLTLFAGVKTVSQGYNWTVERFGKYTRTLQPGLTVIVPFFDRVGRKMNMMEQVMDIPQQDVISKDNATVTVDGLAFFQVFDAAKASYEVAHLDQAIVKLTMTNIRSVMGGMDLDQMLSHRDEINERLLRVVDAAVSPWGVKVNRIEIKDIVPPADLVQAMGRQMKAEREKRAIILEAEGQKQSQILEAEGRREAAFRDAEARERSAQAEAKATEMVSEAIARGDIAALNYFVAEKYLRAFGQLAQSPNQKVLMLPIEAMNVLGSLAGIGEIVKATFGGDGKDGSPATPARRPTGPTAGLGAS